jgi:hypothetical protein
MTKVVKANGVLSPCCIQENMVHEVAHAGTWIDRCRVCGRRHYGAIVPEFAAIGKLMRGK